MYHEDPILYFGTDAGKAGVGADIAILDSGYYLSQVWQYCQAPALLPEFVYFPDWSLPGDGAPGRDDWPASLLYHSGLCGWSGGNTGS